MNYLDTRLKDIKNGYIQHFGVPGMKWGWTKDGKRTGAKEAMTEQERAQRRKELLAKVGKGLGIAAGVAGAALAIKNRKKIGGMLRDFKNRRIIDKPRIKNKTTIKKDINNILNYNKSSINSEAKWALKKIETRKKLLDQYHNYEDNMKKIIPDYVSSKNIKEYLKRSGQEFLYDTFFK